MSMFNLKLLNRFLSGRYRKCLNYPVAILLAIVLLAVAAVPFLGDFRFDASDDSLVAEGDPALAYYREISDIFGGEDFLFFTYEPVNQPLFHRDTLERIRRLADRLQAIAGVAGVFSLLDAPLLENPPVPLAQLQDNVKTLGSDDVDLAQARQELVTSPLFRNLLVSADGRITALRIDLATDARLGELRQQIDTLESSQQLSAEQRRRLAGLRVQLRSTRIDFLAERKRTLDAIRQVRDDLDTEAVAHVGGVPLVAADMITYVQQDILTFGTVVILIIAVMLFAVFRRLRWVMLPLLTTAVSVYFTIAILGLLQQPVTVISSNFISLLAIVSIAFSIHLIRRYRELLQDDTGQAHVDLVFQSLVDKFPPCLYTAITTMVAFGSLLTSAIVPVRDFGLIMCISILVAFLMSFSLFAGILLLLPRGEPSATIDSEPWLITLLQRLSTRHSVLVLLAALVTAVLAVPGISRLSMDNKFINYFRTDTGIYKSLAYIDRHLGGTVPMDIVVSFPPYQQTPDQSADPFGQPDQEFPQRYWFTPDKVQQLHLLQGYLEDQPAIGKVISVATLSRIARRLTDGDALSAPELVAALGAVPQQFRDSLLQPYAAPGEGLMRLSARMHELDRDYLYANVIDGIQNQADQQLDVGDGVRITGMAVLFNNMLDSLYSSQRSTLLFVILATFLLFLLLLRSLALALLGLLPNLLAAATVLAFMGFAGIPLDMMTITIAAIIIGIGVDDAIHFLHRFRTELNASGDVADAVKASHASIGHAIYHTSLVVVVGFSVLAFSNFVPTVYFGLLTALAMVLALLANLSVLPALLLRFYRSP